MSWRDSLHRVVMPDGRKLIGASFRGAPFFVATSARSGGRRAVTHEFPMRDDPHIEDLGRKARTFTLEGYVLGANYVAERDALLSALEDRLGAGELVHPYLGVKLAVCDTVTVNESIADGGMATFSISFLDAPDKATVPIDAVDYVERVEASAVASRVASDAELQATYDIAGLPGFALASARDVIANLSAGLKTAASPVTLTTQELARLTVQVDALVADAEELVRTPEEIQTRFVAALTTLIDSVGEPLNKLLALFGAFDTDPGQAVLPTTPTRTRELANQEGITKALRRSIVVEMARAGVAALYDSIDQALQFRAEITDRLDQELENAGIDAYPSLLDLRASLVSAIPGDTAHTRVVTIEQRTAIPSVALAYRLYGNADSELDIVARNNPRHPGFMKGDLDVLSTPDA